MSWLRKREDIKHREQMQGKDKWKDEIEERHCGEVHGKRGGKGRKEWRCVKAYDIW